MKVYLELLPGDPRVLPDDSRVSLRPYVLPLGAPADQLDAYVASMEAQGRVPWAEVGSTMEVLRAARAGAGLWLRGIEAGGATGTMGALILIRAAATTGQPWVVQGLGRRGMAAALAVGAAGVQLDVHTYLLDDSPLPVNTIEKLRRSGARDTSHSDGFRSIDGIPCSMAIGDAEAGPALDLWLPAFVDDLEARVATSRKHHPLLSDPFGTGTPIVQGPMANISEGPGLAVEIRAAGALPFCALGALRPDAAESVLEGMSRVQEPWGAGIIGFDVMPHRDAHLDAVKASGSRPVILAGGSPALALKLQEEGSEPWLHTPSARLASMAWKRGVEAVIFEGREAGGHVGQLSSAALWEEGLAAAESCSSSVLIVLAGGIGDPISAAFAGAMASAAASQGHRVGLQVGTAFLFTHEILEEGHITSSYQQRALSANSTVLVGDTVGLPLRCTPNPFSQRAIAEEQAWLADGLPLRERRERVEHHNLGRTRVAAKGIERDGQGGHQIVPVRRQLEEGAFTLGDGATIAASLFTVSELIHSLTVDAAALLHAAPARPSSTPIVRAVKPPPFVPAYRPALSASADEPIAIVGLGCILPDANDVEQFWRNLRFGRNSVLPIPDHRWRNDRYFHPDPDHRSTTSYVRMAGSVLDFHFDSTPFGIPPSVVPSMDRAQRFALSAAAQAIRNVRIIDRSRAAVLLGNSMGGEHAKSLAVRVRFREVLTALGRDGDEGLEELVDHYLKATLPPVDVESMSGLLSNVIAGRVASWLNLGGGNATVDAACAASLAAITQAIDGLHNHRFDLVLTGGVDADLSPETFVGFCRTHALSPSGSQPFSARADGFVMGEGAAVFALKRLSDAERHNDPIWALLTGIGQSSDGRSKGITAPKVEGQVLAIRRALSRSGVEPETVEMIEAHGTGTSLGDKTECAALSQIYPDATVGSVKSQIGHLKGGAGAAGLLKAVLSVAHGRIPPTLNAGPLRPAIERGHLHIPRQEVPFRSETRRAGVSAFGFGGTNFHLLVQSYGPPRDAAPLPDASLSWTSPAPLLEIFRGDSPADLAHKIRTSQTTTPEEAASAPHRAARIGKAPGMADWIEAGCVGAFGRTAWAGAGTPRSPVAVFPGQGSSRQGAADVLMRIPIAHDVLLRLEETAPDTSADPAAQHHLLVATGAAYSALLHTLPLAGVIGHSVGELSALCCAGRLSPTEALTLADARGRALGDCPSGAMVAVTGEIEQMEGCWLAAQNSPDSRVFAGSERDVVRGMKRLHAASLRHTRLDVERAFHTPHVQPAADALREVVRDLPIADGLPWWSNVPDVAPRCTDEAVREALVQAVTTTVGFESSLRAAHADGHRLFVHAGPGAALARHIERTLPDATVIPLHPDRTDDGLDLVRAAAFLLAEGHAGMIRALPGTWVQIAFPTEVLQRPVPTGDLLSDLPLREPLAPPAPTSQRPAESVPPVGDPGSVREVVIRSIAEVTGYPRAALVSGATLDADLGIDSIRKMEILGKVQEELNIDVDESALADASDLDIDGLIRLIEGSEPTAPSLPRAAQIWGTGWKPARACVGEAGEVLVAGEGSLTSLLLPLLGAKVLPNVLLAAHNNPAHHGLEAYLRVAAHEAGVPFRAVFADPGVPVPERWLPGTGTVRLTEQGAVEPVACAYSTSHALPEAPVVFASGGTSGILARCLAALPGARGMILGRREEADPPEGFVYRCCDVTDPKAVHAAAAACREQFGCIQIVVHAAGQLRDGPARQNTPDDLHAVLDVKLAGAQALIHATLQDEPEIWAPFSSVSATLTNPGQSLYAAANAALEHTVHPTAKRTVPIAWTAWSEVGMAADSSLQRLLAARGIQSLAPDEGARLFVEALRGHGRAWVADSPWPTNLPWSYPTASDARIALAPTAPAFADHQVAGAPLVPAAIWASALLDGEVELTDFSVLAPTPLRSPRTAVVQAGEISVDGRVVCRAALRPATSLEAPPSFLEAPPSPPLPLLDARPLYDGILFHGPTWRVLQEVGFSAERAVAVVEVEGMVKAGLIDAIYQLLAVFTHEQAGWLGLPTGAKRLASIATEPGRYTLTLHPTLQARSAIADVSITDADGRVVLVADQARIQAASHA